jgi:penicillin-binding protein 2
MFWNKKKTVVSIEPEEIFLDARHARTGNPLPGLGFLESAIHNRSLTAAGALAAALLVLMVGFVLKRGLLESAEARALAENNRLRVFTFGARRGVITDRSGVLLAANKPRFSIVVFPADLPKVDEAYGRLWQDLARAMAGHLDLFEHFAQVARTAPEPFRLPLQPTFDQAALIGKETERFSGIAVVEEQERFYPAGDVFSHVVGYVTKQEGVQAGQAGIEAVYEKKLKGEDGAETWEEDARGASRGVSLLREAEEGARITLTLDAALEQKSLEALSKMLKSRHLARAALAALDPQTGEILALVSTPTFSANELAAGLEPEAFARLRDDPDQPFFNRSIAGAYAPGSTIKPFLAAAALDKAIIDPQKKILVTGSIEVGGADDSRGGYVFRDWRAHGLVDMIRAIAISSNVYFYTIGGGYGDQKGLGIGAIEEYLKRFGFGVKPLAELPGAAAGRVPSEAWKARVKGEPWYIGDTYHVSIGQGDMLATPLQLAAATAVIANGGTRWQPFIVKRIYDKNGERTFLPQKIEDQALPRQTLDIPRQGMRAAVTEGSARLLADLPVPAAGKTGTAETGKGTSHAWFTAFAPYENPQIVLTLVVEEGGEGSAVAVPIAKEILQWWAENRLK